MISRHRYYLIISLIKVIKNQAISTCSLNRSRSSVANRNLGEHLFLAEDRSNRSQDKVHTQ